MTAFRLVLVLMLVVLSGYTLLVILDYGINLFPYFFGDMAALTWAGQFNLDFMFMLMFSGLWVAWRHQFSAAGIGLGVLAFFLGAGFLTVYLLIEIRRTGGDFERVLLGDRMASASPSQVKK